jgi:hypothetical protein
VKILIHIRVIVESGSATLLLSYPGYLVLNLFLLLGTVIIMCKNEVFDLNELHGMMQGRPTRLESKFR